MSFGEDVEKRKRMYPFHAKIKLNEKMLKENGIKKEDLLEQINDISIGYYYVVEIEPGYYVFWKYAERQEFVEEIMDERFFSRYVEELTIVNYFLKPTKWSKT